MGWKRPELPEEPPERAPELISNSNRTVAINTAKKLSATGLIRRGEQKNTANVARK